MPLLIQSIVMILAQLALQYLCVRYPPLEKSDRDDHDLEDGYSRPPQSREDDDAGTSKALGSHDKTRADRSHPFHSIGDETDGDEVDDDELDITDSPDLEDESMIKDSDQDGSSSRPKMSRKASSKRKTSYRLQNTSLPELKTINPVDTRTGRPFNFWRWKTFAPYLGYCLSLTVVMIPLIMFLGSFKAFVTVLGVLSLSFETVLPLPALYTIIRNRSSEGLRLTVPITWLFGDCYKTVFYFTTDGNSAIFKLSALILIVGDLSILVLSAWYGTLGEKVRARLGR